MARRRAVERVRRREGVLDRLVAGALVVVAASGLMSVLPGRGQAAVTATACRLGSLGLGACGPDADATGVDLGADALAPPRCPVLADLDATVPEVRTRTLTTARGLVVRLAADRSGDTVLRLGPGPDPAPPDLLAGDGRADVAVLPGTAVPAGTAWLLPGGQGAATVVGAAHDRQRAWSQRRSALALPAVLTRDHGRDLPAPTRLASAVDLRRAVLPGGPASVPAAPPAGGRGPDGVRLDPARPATVVLDTTTGTSAVTADLRGRAAGRPVAGAVRWTRDAGGGLTGLVLALAATGPLVNGQPAGAATTVVYLRVPVRTPVERALVEERLAAAGGLALDLDGLLALRPPAADDRLGGFLARAATVTVLGWDGPGPGAAAGQLRTELDDDARQLWPDARLVSAGAVAPQPTGTARVLRDDPGCVGG
ncbi:hypothetical protein ACFFOM_12005 [Microlunatus capsulatus]|uniref:Type VII secretion protein EccB n=1 Tax=Microlunatus capsulatus TaxID=99117 RepID=A0ABS4Z908_9ACTN|nr:hypothetical protein [Microlunatus capsulatus]MBP2417532.1 hypothetical protein [Microlunatus capsulatus]